MAQPLKWHGGKYYMTRHILARVPTHLHRVHAYFGGGAEFFQMPHEGFSEVVNDLNGRLTNFWHVLQDPQAFAEFLRIVQATPFSESEWWNAAHDERELEPTDVDAAVAFFIACRQSRQGLCKSFATLSKNRTRRGMNEQAASWLSAVEGLPDAHQRLRGVVISCRPALEVIRSEDSPNTFFYLDPPYHPSTRSSPNAYEYEMTHDDHEELLATLSDIQGSFMLSGYSCELYEDWAQAFGWRKDVIEIDNKSSGASVKQIKQECLWMNYPESRYLIDKASLQALPPLVPSLD